MKKNRIFSVLSGMALLLAGACSNDDVVKQGPGNDPEPGRDGVYMTVSINPNSVNGTRSETNGNNSSTGGLEVGTKEENSVKKVLIVLANPQNNEFLAASLVETGDNLKGIGAEGNNPNYQNYRATAKFSKTSIGESCYEGENVKFGGKVNVFIICNPPATYYKTLTDEDYQDETPGAWTQMEWNESDGKIWMETTPEGNTIGSFTMTNEIPAVRKLPATLSEWNNYNTELKAFDLSDINGAGTSGVVDNSTQSTENIKDGVNQGGPINVHRMAARFDFRDGSQVKDGGKIIGNGVEGSPYTYAVVKNSKGNTIVNCELYGMALTNMSVSQYYLGRVSGNGLNNGATLCGYETKSNYVVSTNASAKKEIIQGNFNTYFNYPFFDQGGKVQDVGDGWSWTYYKVENKPKDSNAKTESKEFGTDYSTWRYASENTIPSPNTTQTNSQSTGVIFKARLLPTDELKNSDYAWEKMLYDALEYNSASVGDGKLLHNNPATDPVLYSLSGNTLYVTWENVQEQALIQSTNSLKFPENNNEIDRNSPMYRKVFGTGGFGTVNGLDDEEENHPDATSANSKWLDWQKALIDGTETSDKRYERAFKAQATAEGFTIYQSSKDPDSGLWGYYCYYYYWNRHNDNGDPGLMGTMEFAVVRNNVYKLTVVSLNTLGHPRKPENDPDDPTPDTPDEKSEIYLKVSVEVLPWVVRVNDIHF